MIFQTLGFFIVFLFLTWLTFYPLGYIFISKNVHELESYEIITLSFAVSIIFFVIISVFLSAVNLRFLLTFLILGLSLFSIYRFRWKILMPWKSFFKNRILLVLIFAGILVQGFINFPSGYLYKEGLLFWSSQGFDGLWHISLMEAIVRGLPPETPIFSGVTLQNYHYLVDILMGEYYRIYNFFSPLDLYFRFFPVLFSFLMGISVFSFMSRWKNELVGRWAVFFTYFVGSFGFVLTYIKSGKILGGETAFWVSQLNTVIANPPHASAITLLCAFLLSFLIFTKSKSKGWFFICVLIGSVIAGFKISGGIVLLAGLGIVSLFQIINEKRIEYAILFLLILISNFAVVRLISPNPGSFLIFQPWWFIRNMVVEKLGLVDWELRRQTYLSIGRFTSYLRVLQLEATALLIFIVGNLGVRVIGFPIMIGKLIHFKKKIFESPIDTFLLAIGFIGFMVPLLFLQKGVAWTIIQFMQYTLLVTGFYGAIFTHAILKKMKSSVFKYLFVFVLVILSIPTVIGNFVEFYGNPPNSIVSNNEIFALKYLRDNSKYGDIILTPPFNVNDKYGYKQNPLPIYAWTGTAYVSALTGRSTFLSCEDQLHILGYDINKRLNDENEFFSQKDLSFNRTFLMDNNIAFLYIPNPKKYSLDVVNNGLEQVFANDEVVIYKVI